MKNSKTPISRPAFAEKDADQLIASFGRAVDPAKKAALMERLQKERGAFEKSQRPPPTKKERGLERG